MKTPCSFSEWKDCFCNSAPTLNNIRKGFTQLLKYCFSNTNHYSDNKEYLGCMVYSDDPSESQLSITAKGAYDPSNTQLVPGIQVSLAEGVQFNRQGARNTLAVSKDTARETLALQARANVQIRCSHKDADISCAMADMCMLFFMAAIKHINQAWGWVDYIDIVQQTEPKLNQQSESDSSNKWYDSTLVIQIVYQYSINIDTESKRLKEYTLDANSYL